MTDVTYFMAYVVSITVMVAVSLRFARHHDEPLTFLGMIVPVVIPLVQETFAIEGSDPSPFLISLLQMVVTLSTSYFLGSALAVAFEVKDDRIWTFYLSFLLWGTSGALIAGERLQSTSETIGVFGLGVVLPMMMVAGISLWMRRPKKKESPQIPVGRGGSSWMPPQQR